MRNEKPVFLHIQTFTCSFMYCESIQLSFFRENEEWNKLHKVLAPKMLRPGSILENLEKLSSVARDAVDYMMVLRGLNGEMPDLEGEIAKYVAECKFFFATMIKFLPLVFFRFH